MNNIKHDLDSAAAFIDSARKRLEEDQTVGLTEELIDALRALDEYYKEYCSDLDEEYGDVEGTTYDNEYGPSIEFYIEADDWHDISLALRKLLPKKADD